MKEAVEKVLREEELARRKVEQARAEAESIIAGARKNATDILEETAAATKDLAEKKTDESLKQFLSEKEEILSATKEQNAALRKAREKDVTDISRALFMQIINIED
ncbi:MAG: hypothetical protein ACM3IL_02570 [Deltaproteobacteria bacterium]